VSKPFTDLLDEYLSTRSLYAVATGDLAMITLARHEAARDALNEAFDQMKGEKSE